MQILLKDHYDKNHRLIDLSETHVLFDGINASLKVSSGSIHVGDHGANVTDNGSKNQHTHL